MKENNIGPYAPYLGTPHLDRETGIEIFADKGKYYARNINSGIETGLDSRSAWLLSWFISTNGMISYRVISQAMESHGSSGSRANVRTYISRLNTQIKLLGDYLVVNRRSNNLHSGLYYLRTPTMEP